MGSETYQTKKAERLKAEYQSRVIDTSDGTWFIAHKDIDIVPLHSTPYLRINGHERELTPDEVFYSRLNAPRVVDVTPLLSDGRESIPELLPLLDRSERVLIKGASDAGKTTLIQHTAIRATDEVIIVDPHYKPGIWPQCKVIGAGRNFPEIAKFLQWLELELDKRYKMRMAGDESWTRYTVIIDEYMSIASECDNAKHTLSAMIRESRKVGFRLFICSHSELLKPLGLDGQGDVREGLLIVRLYYSQLKQERRSTIDDGNGEIPCYFPPYYGSGSNELDELKIPDLVIKTSDKEDRIIEMIWQGASNQDIAQQVFKKSNLSGDNFYLVKDLRRRLLLDHNDRLDSST